MSIVRFTGGLGNQLFQICFGRTLGVTTGTSTIYDAAEYKYRSRNAERKLEIPKSCEISIINRTNLLISKLPNNFLLPIETKQRGKIDWRSSHKNKIILEGRDIYDRELVLEPNSYYVGNFVSYRYWKEDPEVILSWISETSITLVIEALTVTELVVTVDPFDGELIVTLGTLHCCKVTLVVSVAVPQGLITFNKKVFKPGTNVILAVKVPFKKLIAGTVFPLCFKIIVPLFGILVSAASNK